MNEDNQDTNTSRMMKFDPAVLVVSHIRTISKFLPLVLYHFFHYSDIQDDFTKREKRIEY